MRNVSEKVVDKINNHFLRSTSFYENRTVYETIGENMVQPQATIFYGASTRNGLWLRRCATNRKVAGSIPDGVIGICHWHKPSDRTMALGSTQPLTEISTRRISWG